MNLNDHPTVQAIYDACQACEQLPASEQQTRTVAAIGAIALHATALFNDHRALWMLADEFLESPPDDADGYWENFGNRLRAVLASGVRRQPPVLRDRATRHLFAELQQGKASLRRLLKTVAPQCKPLPTLDGLASQIDNYIAGQQAKREPTMATYYRVPVVVYQTVQAASPDEARVRAVECLRDQFRYQGANRLTDAAWDDLRADGGLSEAQEAAAKWDASQRSSKPLTDADLTALEQGIERALHPAHPFASEFVEVRPVTLTALLTELRHREKDCEAARSDRDRFQTELRQAREERDDWRRGQINTEAVLNDVVRREQLAKADVARLTQQLAEAQAVLNHCGIPPEGTIAQRLDILRERYEQAQTKLEVASER